MFKCLNVYNDNTLRSLLIVQNDFLVGLLLALIRKVQSLFKIKKKKIMFFLSEHIPLGTIKIMRNYPCSLHYCNISSQT